MQYIRVEVEEGRAYTYKWSGRPVLRKGERVVLPGNVVHDKEFVGTVLRLLDEPDTDFPLKEVVRRERKLSDEDMDLL